MLLPLQGESAIVYSSPRAPLRSALGYAQVAPAGRVFKIGIKICSKKVSILSAFRLLIFNTFKVKNSSLNICTTRCILVTL